MYIQGTLLHLESDEAHAQLNPVEEEVETVEESESQISVAGSALGSQTASAAASNASVQAAEEKPKKKEKLIKNQFNYQDRGTQSGTTVCIIQCQTVL